MSRRWAVLLRGVNVGGVTVRSAALAERLRDAGFGDVRSVLASGNVSLSAPAGHDAATVRAGVEAALRAGFGYEARVVVLDPARLAQVAAGYPFARADDEFHPYCVFASDPGRLADLVARASALRGSGVPAGRDQERDQEQEEDRLEPAGDVLYWRVRKGSTLTSPVGRLVAARTWAPVLTTRNLRTVEKLVAVCAAAAGP